MSTAVNQNPIKLFLIIQAYKLTYWSQQTYPKTFNHIGYTVYNIVGKKEKLVDAVGNFFKCWYKF